jgi:hypothetical protein
VLKRTGMQTWRPERVVCVGVGGGDGTLLPGQPLESVFLQSASLSMLAGLTLSVDTVTDLPRTSSFIVFCLRERTW